MILYMSYIGDLNMQPIDHLAGLSVNFYNLSNFKMLSEV